MFADLLVLWQFVRSLSVAAALWYVEANLETLSSSLSRNADRRLPLALGWYVSEKYSPSSGL